MAGNDEDHDDLALLGQYRVLRRPEEGSMWWLGWGVEGMVYKARRTADADAADAPEVVLRVSAWQTNEKIAHLLATLHHPHVAALLATDHATDGRCVLVMERAAGESLADLVKQRGPLPAAEALELARQVALGLQAAGALGLVHPHLGPDVLRFTAATQGGAGSKDNVVKIVSYEAAALLPPSPGRWGGEGSGGPRWLSPEEKEHRVSDRRTDYYKLGLVLWFLLVGESPLPLLSSVGNNDLPQTFLDRLPASAPEPVRALLARLLARAPGERPQSAEELLQDIEACQAGRAMPPPAAATSASVEDETSTGDTTCIPLDSLPRPLAPAPATTPATPSPALDENVQFTAYRPKVVQPNKWAKLLVFAHLEERPAWMDADERAPLEEMAAQAAAILGPQHAEDYKQTTDDSRLAVPREGEITFVPELAGVEFNPPHRTFFWKDGVSVHGETFDLRAGAALDGKTARGRLTVFLGPLVLAEISLAIRVDSQLGNLAAKEAEVAGRERSSARPFRKIFASYSHRDVEIVESVERHARTLGDEYLRDWLHLRSGEKWDARLRKIIEEADIFQLFWSQNAARSEFVEREWQHALSLRRDTFVRPTYWQDPMPPPPEPLRQLHFHRLGAAAGATGATTPAPAQSSAMPITPQAVASSPAAAPVPMLAPAAASLSPVEGPARRRLPIGALAGALTVVLLAVAGAGLFLRQQRSASEPGTLAYATPSHPPTMTPNVVPTPQPSASDDPQQRAALAFLAAADRAEAEKNRAEAIEDYAAACAAAGEAFAREHTPAGKAYADPQQLQKELSRFDAKFNGPAHQPSASLLVQRANLRLALGRWDAAAEDYAQALKLEPESAEAKRGLVLAKAAAAPAATATPSQESGEKSQQAAP